MYGASEVIYDNHRREIPVQTPECLTCGHTFHYFKRSLQSAF